MREHKIRHDLPRAVVDGYALPLGIQPLDLPAPVQGYTLTYTPGEDGDPDTYAFHVVVSHDRLRPIIRDAFTLLPDDVVPIVEVGSRDAYRALDVYLGADSIPADEFLASWRHFEDVILEDASIGAGANADEPFIEIFVDSWKGLCISVPIAMRREVERLLSRHGLREVMETWPDELERSTTPPSTLREVLLIEDEQSPDLDEVLLQLREEWSLELNIDPDQNVDERGRPLGHVLWTAIAMAVREGRRTTGAYVTVWATASSLSEIEDLVQRHVAEHHPGWTFDGFFSVDRVAFDERPDELGDLPPRRDRAEIHLCVLEEW
jgi:hypothetical protein